MTGNIAENNELLGTGSINVSQIGTNTMRKANLLRTSYPKLMSVKRTIVQEENTKTMNPEKIIEREFLSRFSRIQDLDKEKQIKFAQFLGDKPLTEAQIEAEQALIN